MPLPPFEILLVTPVWNDSARLAGFGAELAGALAASPLPIHWVIADDGSDTREHPRLRKLTAEFEQVFPKVSLHLAARHAGKGSIVREAWALSPEAAWLAFVDADGSVSPEEMLRIIDAAVGEDSSVLGIRKRTATTQLVESPWRGLFHRGFLIVVRVLLGLRCEDPQCGAKVLKGASYRRIAPGLCENGLAFDSELLFALRRDGSTWREVPVNWIEKGGGKVKPLRDAWGMLLALWRVRRRSFRGV
jgi:glycosyltransferase involved in cell wall biosynthesis